MMTQKELVDYLKKQYIEGNYVCPPDMQCGGKECSGYKDCPDCYRDFVNTRYKKHKLQKKGH